MIPYADDMATTIEKSESDYLSKIVYVTWTVVSLPETKTQHL